MHRRTWGTHKGEGTVVKPPVLCYGKRFGDDQIEVSTKVGATCSLVGVTGCKSDPIQVVALLGGTFYAATDGIETFL